MNINNELPSSGSRTQPRLADHTRYIVTWRYNDVAHTVACDTQVRALLELQRLGLGAG